MTVNYDRVSKIVLSRLRTRPWTFDASDAYQQAYLHCLEYDPKYSRLVRKWAREPWLVEMVFSQMKREYRKEMDWARRKFPACKGEYQIPATLPSVSGAVSENPSEWLEAYDNADSVIDLLNCVEKLKPQVRTIMLLMIRGWSDREISKHRDIPLATVQRYIAEGISKLREIMS